MVVGMTFFGDTNGLTMKNCPWHEDVVEYAKKLTEYLLNFK